MRVGGKNPVLSPRASRLESCGSKRARVILFGGAKLTCPMPESDFEVLPCPHVNSLAEFTGGKPPVILVDLAILSDADKSKLIKHMGRVNAPLAVALSDSADADT